MPMVSWIILWLVAAGLFLWQLFRVKSVGARSEALLDRIYRQGSQLDERLGKLEMQVRALRPKSPGPSPMTDPGAQSAGGGGYIPLDVGGGPGQVGG
jgi:hypothetical protein